VGQGLIATITTEAVAASPNWAEVLTALSSVALAVLGAFALGQIRETQRDRHYRVIADILNGWDARRPAVDKVLRMSSQEVLDVVERNFDPERPSEEEREEYIELISVANYLEALGGYVQAGVLGPDVVAQHMGTDVILMYEKWAPSIGFLQSRRPTNLQQFKDMALKVNKLREGS
jgi:hypothetical protein